MSRRWEDSGILCLEARALPHSVHGPATQPSSPPHLGLPALRKKIDADLVFQFLVCVPFVAELTWPGFPSEVITYLSLPYEICFLKSQQPLAFFFFPS